MPFKPNTFALTCLLALLTALGPLSTDMYLPSLPALGRAFAVDQSSIQLTLSAFLFGFAGGQIVYGPLADRYGRKPVILAGLVLYCAASLACVLAPNIDTLVVARFIQAFAASGPIVLARSVVRDLYSGDSAGLELARMGSIMGLVPAVAPVLGGVLEQVFGWQSSFWAMVLFGAFILVSTWFGLEESLKEKSTEPLAVGPILRAFRDVSRNADFRLFALTACGSYGGLFAFISGSSFILQNDYGLNEVVFGFAFGFCALAYVLGTFAGRTFVRRWGGLRAILVGSLCLASGGLLMISGVLYQTGQALEVILPMMLYMVGVGIALPQAMARAIMPFPEKAGSASSLLGFLQMSFGAATGLVIGQLIHLGPLALASCIAVLGVLVFLAQLPRALSQSTEAKS